jgi:hypothetical protein
VTSISPSWSFDILTGEDRLCVIEDLRREVDLELPRSGQARLLAWERGWSENFTDYKSKNHSQALIPKYFRPHALLRMGNEIIRPHSPHFEYEMLSLCQLHFFRKYLRHVAAIYEFGCGTGHNLLRLRGVNADAKLWGLDWAESSEQLVEEIAMNQNDRDLFARRFDLFAPDPTFHLGKNSAVVTVAALEQIGTRFQGFLNYLLEQGPKICIHLEPVVEFLESDNELDRLSIQYLTKRNYLRGFFTRLKELETDGDIEILQAERNPIGQVPLQAYSVIVWRPKS